MAGPWFAVHRSGDDWQRLEQVWVSNGEEDCRGWIEVKIRLENQPHDGDAEPELSTVTEEQVTLFEKN